ncbi:MAG: hypothetical protein AABY16_04080 [Nanoarchaeota archaeon]
MARKFFFVFVILLFFFSFAAAQLGGIEDRIDDTRDNLEGNVDTVREFTERDKWTFIGSQWKEFLLKNKLIAGVDAAFTKANIVFVVLFAKPWELSIEMLFVFMLWLFTVLSLYLYFFYFKTKWIRWVGSVLGAIALAQTRLFNYVSAGMYKLVLYKPSAGWRLLIIAVEVIALIAYLKINKVISKQLEKARKKREEHDKELEIKGIKAYQEGLAKGVK